MSFMVGVQTDSPRADHIGFGFVCATVKTCSTSNCGCPISSNSHADGKQDTTVPISISRRHRSERTRTSLLQIPQHLPMTRIDPHVEVTAMHGA